MHRVFSRSVRAVVAITSFMRVGGATAHQRIQLNGLALDLNEVTKIL